jgi:cell division protein FtsA
MRRIRMGIDIGSSKTTIIVGELYDQGKNIRILGKAIIPSNGVKKGKIIDVELFSRTLKIGKERLEDKIGIKLKKATVGISGSDIKTSTTEVEYKLLDENVEEPIEVTEAHCNQIFEISKQKVVKDDEQILGKEVYNYRLDDSGIMKTPVGKVGKKLEARVHLIKIPKERVDRVIEALNKAGIEVESLLYNGEASAKAALKRLDKINGVALVDIGDGLTEITIFKNNRLISTNVIPIGGMHYINDLKYVLELNGEVVKNILLEIKDKNDNEKVTVSFLDKGSSVTKTFEVKYLREIIDARTDEILEYILKSIEASGYKDYLKNGIVLAGGVVSSYNILEKLKGIFGENIRIGTAINISGMTTQLKDPSAVSGMGVLLTALEDEYNDLLGSSVVEENKEKNTTKIKEEKVEEKKEVKVEEKKVDTKTSKPLTKSKFKKWLGNFI